MYDSANKLEKQTTENKPNVEEIDIYADILTDQDGHIKKLKEKVDTLYAENKNLTKHLNSLQKKYEDLLKINEDLEKKYKTVNYNVSSLYKTAQAEIERKNQMIKDLRREQDNLVFRKTRTSQAVERARRVIGKSPKKCRTHKKIDNHEENVHKEVKESILTPQETLITSTEQKIEQAGAENSDSERFMVSEFPPQETLMTTTEQQIEQGDEKNVNSINCISSEVSNLNNISNIPPPMQGPQNAYSKRLYKKLYGVSPPKPLNSVRPSNSSEKLTEIAKNDISPEVIASNKTCNPLNKTISEDELITTENAAHEDSKLPCIALKLKEEVKEFIKLGSITSNKSSTPTNAVNKIHPINKTNVSPSKNEQTKQNITRSLSSQQLILQCDLRTQNNLKGKIPSPNSVSINETIENILKNHKAGLYNNSAVQTSEKQITSPNNTNCKLLTNPEPDNEILDKKENTANSKVSQKLQEKGEENKRNRLLENLNKRMSNKPLISPVTFGKLVTSASFPQNTTTSSNSEMVSSGKEQTDISRKRKLSEVSHPLEDTLLHQSQKSKLAKGTKTGRKPKFLHSLFGESPLKSQSPDKKPAVNVEDKSNEEFKSTSVINNPDSPIFPSSPSLDSDSPEDLIIDSTACSVNTSPRVSEISQKEDEEKKNNLDITKDLFRVSADSKLVQETNNCENDDSSVAEIKTLDKDREIKYKGEKNQNAGSDLEMNVKGNIELNIENKDLKCKGNIAFYKNCPDDKEKETPCLPDLSECLSLDNTNQIPHKSIPVSRNTAPSVKLENCLPINIVQKAESTEISFESARLNPGANSEKSQLNNNKIDNDSNTQRFIPSPPQLTLVSAFRHSENSVFNITEDTVGFVSALTRVRDISPLRTPDKKNKLPAALNIPHKELKQMHVIKNDSSELSKTTHLDVQTIKTVGIYQGERSDNGTKQTNLLTSSESLKHIEQVTINYDAVENEGENNGCDSLNHILDQKHTEVQSYGSSDEKSINKDTTTDNERTVITNQQNEFKRNRPVKRIMLQTKSKIEVLATHNKENVKNKLLGHTTSQESISRNNNNPEETKTIKHKEQSDETSPVTIEKLIPPNVGKFESKCAEKPHVLLKSKQSMVYNQVHIAASDSSGNISKTGDVKQTENATTKTKLALSSVSSPLETLKSEKNIFKRSESLKMMPKPIPKVNYDVLSKTTNAKINLTNNYVSTKSKINTQLLNEKNRKNPKIKKSDELSKRNINSIKEDKSNENSTLQQSGGKFHLGSKQIQNITESKLRENNVKSCINDSPTNKKDLFTVHNDTKLKKINEGRNENTKPLQIAHKIETDDLDQIPHIAHINKKVRVSKYKSTNEVKQTLLQEVPDRKDEKVSLNSGNDGFENKDSLLTPTKKMETVNHSVCKTPSSDVRKHRSTVNSSPEFSSQKKINESPVHENSRRPGCENSDQSKDVSSRYVNKHDRKNTYIHPNDSRKRDSYHSRSPRNRSNHHRRSPSNSPDQNYSRHHTHISRTRSSHRSRRSRSYSPRVYKRSKSKQYYQERKPRKGNRSNHWKRTRSRSPHRSRCRWSRSRSPIRINHEIDTRVREIRPPNEEKLKERTTMENTTNQNHIEAPNASGNENSYNEELELLKKELKLLKSKLIENKTSTSESLSTAELVAGSDSEGVKKLLVEPTEQLNKSSENEEEESRRHNNSSGNEHVVESLNHSNPEVSSNHSCTAQAMVAEPSPLNNKPMKIIKIHRRRVRTLGDSDVSVVSSSNTMDRTGISDSLTASKGS
ncbi:probable serine/threonine-protein kinase DDB_G0282963 [Homalodisca vitripennis]|uniref:probable serine/threonine-protein kinase DDB_G0282963 n=1 Tax=Homalodisca vitripennis TaxID=197043 RepID=UPI001EEA8E41|nr:probable serine/threonine-protein kinase DDB_G0282963 [Homalodisca vitripennis]